MIRALKSRHFLWLYVFTAILALFAINVAPALAADYALDWSSIGFVDGTSSLQTFNNVNGSGIDMTTEFRVLNSSFTDLGPYVPGTTPLNLNMPRPDGSALAVRDINVATYPGTNVGYILTKITFSQCVEIDDLWLESFYNWTEEGVRKQLALQAFDVQGNAIVPTTWTIYGGASSLVIDNHPGNGKSWLRSSYDDSQTTFAGAEGISYGSQGVCELHWYSWGFAEDGSFSHLLGSTYLGDFQFSTIPTAINLVSSRAVGETGAAAALLPAVFLFGLTALVVARQRYSRKA